jgi:hypothetical protein
MNEVVKQIVGFIDDAAVEAGYQKLCAANRGNTEILYALELERKGGLCPLCQTPYAKMFVDNIFGKFTYYEPACYCFKRCNLCGRFLVVEKLTDIGFCTTCYKKDPIEKHKEKRMGKPGFRDGKAEAAGDKNSD